MTDITELAQSLKAAAEKATPGPWHLSNENKLLIRDEDGVWIAHVGYFDSQTEISDGEFIALANPANIIALVEALEKAQLVDDELCKLLPPGVEYMDPPDGGDVTPLEGVRRMVADYRQRIAELESRTVTVKMPNQTQFDDPLSAYEAIEKCKEALTVEGIKWEVNHD